MANLSKSCQRQHVVGHDDLYKVIRLFFISPRLYIKTRNCTLVHFSVFMKKYNPMLAPSAIALGAWYPNLGGGDDDIASSKLSPWLPHTVAFVLYLIDL